MRILLKGNSARAATPTGEEIERFIVALVLYVDPGSGAGPSLSCVRTVIAALTQSCVFHYAEFHLSAHNRARMASQLERLVQEGRLTRKKQGVFEGLA